MEKWKNSVYYLNKTKKKDVSYTLPLLIVYEFYGFCWCKSNHLDLRWKKNSPLVAKGYPLSGETIFKKQNNYAPILEITD